MNKLCTVVTMSSLLETKQRYYDFINNTSEITNSIDRSLCVSEWPHANNKVFVVAVARQQSKIKCINVYYLEGHLLLKAHGTASNRNIWRHLLPRESLCSYRICLSISFLTFDCSFENVSMHIAELSSSATGVHSN